MTSFQHTQQAVIGFFSFFPCITASKETKYSVVAFPLPLLNQPTDTPKKNYQYRLDWLTWQIETCIANSIMYLDDAQLTIGFGRLELKINSSSLFNYNCPLSFTLDNHHGEKENVFFDNGIALRSDVQSGLYELKFFLDGTLGGNTYIKKKIKKDYSMKGRCLSFPCGMTAVCNQHKNEHYCSCQPGQVLKEETNCFIDDPCEGTPCGDGGTCKRIETKSRIFHTCTCYRGFYAAYNTCMVDPCDSNPCVNGQCLTIESDSTTGLEYTCQCSTGFYHVHNTCKNDPCNGGPCGDGGICKRIETKPSIFHTCTCYRGFYAAYNTCMVDPCYSNPCVNGQCLTIESDSNLEYTCQCSTGFYHVHNTCKTDPCYHNPCDNGTCIVLVKSSSVIDYSCTCYLGFYLGNETCQYDYCYDNVCSPGSDCVNNNNGYTCQCLSSYIPQNGKCVRNEDNNVLEVIIGITGALIGVVLILIVLVAKHCYNTPYKTSDKSRYSSQSDLQVEDTRNSTFFGDMIANLQSFSLSSSPSENGTQHEHKTVRMDSSTVDYPLLDHQRCQANDSDVYYYGNVRPSSASSSDARSHHTSSIQLYPVPIANADPEAQFKQDVVERESSL
ncbi:uncharacterized protein [Antedon mediterranea]|uniref:uncharacterized protein isoform X2 n=1 Tax=Antedon mediterranea TaxID=105859 RepID=UPI003AF8436B